MLDKGRDVVVLFQDAATPLSDDDGGAILCYLGTVATRIILIVQASARDRRNWMAIQSWAAGLLTIFQLEVPKAARQTYVT